jgi:hypothetical protein
MLAKAVGATFSFGVLLPSEEEVCSEPEHEKDTPRPFPSRRCSFNLFPCLDMQANQTVRKELFLAAPLNVS